jgi:hypothetical protein
MNGNGSPGPLAMALAHHGSVSTFLHHGNNGAMLGIAFLVLAAYTVFKSG